jgi:hypothetical protein
MELVAAAIGALTIVVLVAIVLRFRSPGDDRTGRISTRADIEPHRMRAAAEAEMEEHDIDDMLDAISDRRRRRGRRDVGEELSDELLRATWEE